MSGEIILEGLNYAQENFMMPIFVHGKNEKTLIVREEYIDHDILHIVPIRHYKLAQDRGFRRVLPVYEMEDVWDEKVLIDNVILNVKQDEINKLSDAIGKLIKFSNRINLNITGLNRHFNENEYKYQMEIIRDKIVDIWENEGSFKEISLLTDILFLDKHENCQAGQNSFVLSPLGKIHTCCAEFSNVEDDFIGETRHGIIKEYGSYLYEIQNSNLCRICDAYQCKDCVYINKKNTKEYNVPPSFQCRKSHIERGVSLDLKSILRDCPLIPDKNTLEIKNDDYLDPISKFFGNNNGFAGYYKHKL